MTIEYDGPYRDEAYVQVEAIAMRHAAALKAELAATFAEFDTADAIHIDGCFKDMSGDMPFCDSLPDCFDDYVQDVLSGRGDDQREGRL